MASDPYSDAQYCDMDQGSALDAELEKVHSLVIREVIRDVCLACRLLDLPIDPTYWKIDHVEKWLLWTIHEYNIPPINFDYFKMNGINLCMLSEDDFRARAPHCGDIIHAQLDIWRIAAKMNVNEQQSFRQTTNATFFQDQEYMDTSMSPRLDTSGTDSASDDESVQSPGASHASMTPNHTTNIHLWQFLKELLLQPERYGGCIRWLNREEGIFKIEDSVEVAKLWGTRKNRPAMNYDKLSRSIRQYYKKGIIKKTDVSQRLVYQFVKP
ncbi:SAM pointed domain-containing Ets transcription factor-like [Saccoglossus kowalevskii]|uniref:SAM pointed domain-containing Ets transcription factor-like n=1 Tax=Saccoglossus kowalevskii TaxID=10224 RepID=A0ABM0MNZ6_SACKO|nr:PREDICTED: SAM pointed domain-containing Ets transcription factor-like [Saccoglossus kowalevskii]